MLTGAVFSELHRLIKIATFLFLNIRNTKIEHLGKIFDK